MIMPVNALLVVASQSIASLHLYWAGMLLVHPTPKNQSFAECLHHTFLYVVFHRHSKVNYSCATFQNLQNNSCFMFLFSSWGSISGFVIFHTEFKYLSTCMRNVLVTKKESWLGQ